MKTFITALFLVLQLSTAHAAITHEDLQDLVYQRDFVAVESAVAQAHKESLAGDISFDDLRSLTGVLFRTHPDTEDFVEDWIALMPDSTYALTAKSWSLFNEAGTMRGSKIGNRTPRWALEAFNELQNEAMDLAMVVYEADPDYVPASDAIIRLQGKTKRLWSWQIQAIVFDVMDVTPNAGTLLRASELSDRRWGGRGVAYNEDLCEAFANKIPEYPDLTYDDCLVALLAENNQFEVHWNYIADVLDRSDHQFLAYARVRRAIEREAPQDIRLLLDYVQDIDLSEPWLTRPVWVAHRVARLRYKFASEDSNLLVEFQNTLQENVQAQLVHDPFRMSLLRIAAQEHPRIGDYPYLDSRDTVRRTYKLRIAFAQPYHVQNWINASLYQPALRDPKQLNNSDTTQQNAVVFSGHDINMLTNFIQSKVTQYNEFLSRTETRLYDASEWPNEAEFYSEVGCKLATLIRLFEDDAERFPENRNATDGFRISQNLDWYEQHIKEQDFCNDIWDAQIEELYLEPIMIDRRDMLEIPAYIRRWEQ